MNAPETPRTWLREVIAFTETQLPPAFDRDGWQHSFISAYQMGCELLAALGRAEETDWGAIPRPSPRLPETLPRWDDSCAVIRGLAEQSDLLSCRRPDGREPPARAA